MGDIERRPCDDCGGELQTYVEMHGDKQEMVQFCPVCDRRLSVLSPEDEALGVEREEGRDG